MKTLGKFIALPVAKKLLVCEVFCCVVLMRVLLTCVAFRWLFGWSQRWERKAQALPAPHADPVLERNLARLVRTVSSRIPKATCLTQAFSLQMLLARRHQYSKLCIGVNKKSDGQFHAHAWLKTGHGIAIGGGSELDTFRPLRH